MHARIGNRVLAAELRRRIGVPVRDLGPMRAARREALIALPMSDRRFGYPLEMVVRAAEAGWRIVETDVPYYPRTGKSKVTGTLGGTVRTVRDMRRVLASMRRPVSVARVMNGPRRTGREYTGKHRRATIPLIRPRGAGRAESYGRPGLPDGQAGDRCAGAPAGRLRPECRVLARRPGPVAPMPDSTRPGSPMAG